MKKIILFVLLIGLMAVATACSNDAGSDGTKQGQKTDVSVTEDREKDNDRKEQTKDDMEAADAAEEAVSGAVVASGEVAEADLLERSKSLALQMAEGDFEQTYQSFAPIMKGQYPKQWLEKDWIATVSDLGNYKEIYSVEEKTEDKYKNVYIVLKYENYGLRLTLVYNEKEKIEGIWLHYVTAGIDLETTDLFSEQAIKIGEDYPVDGILTLPKGVTKPPVVILVHGSGTHDWDETVGPGVNKPFRDIAQGLAEQGIASIRYQERLAAYPELASERVTIQLDSLDDVDAAITYAAACDLIDTDRIYILGHSLGGVLAPKIASDYKEVKGIIILAGSPRKLEDIAADQQELLLKMSKTEIAKARKDAEAIKGLTEESTGNYLGMPASYWYSLNQIDVPEIVKSLTIPMFIAQGSADFQIYADRDYPAWQVLLKDRKEVTLKLYDNLNHMFMKSNGVDDLTEYLIPSTVDREVIDDMAAWVHKN